MRMVFLDTAPMIYLVEGAENRRKAVHDQLLAWTNQGASFGTSALTLMEMLIHPKKKNDVLMQGRYLSLLSEFVAGHILPIDETIADKAAEFRARIGLKTPDVLQLACAVVNGYDTFYTNDRRLRRVGQIEIVLVV
jgi:predicted nucleic acid-binding protein